MHVPASHGWRMRDDAYRAGDALRIGARNARQCHSSCAYWIAPGPVAAHRSASTFPQEHRIMNASRALCLTAMVLGSAFGAPYRRCGQTPAPAAPSAIPADPWPRVVDRRPAHRCSCTSRRSTSGPTTSSTSAPRSRYKKDGREGPGLRRALRHRAHAGRQGRAHRRVREPADLEDRLPDAARQRRELSRPSSPRNSRRRCARSSLDQLQASLAAAGVKPPTVEVAQQSAAGHRQLLAGDPGADRRRAGDQAGARHSRFQRVINTRALILQGGLEQNFYMHVYDGWLSASSIDGPWTQSFRPAVRHGRPRDAAREERTPSTC